MPKMMAGSLVIEVQPAVMGAGDAGGESRGGSAGGTFGGLPRGWWTRLTR